MRDYKPVKSVKKSPAQQKSTAKSENAQDTQNTPNKTTIKVKNPHELIYGTHAVNAALSNPNRVLKNLYITPNRQKDYETFSHLVKIQSISKEDMDLLLPAGCTHQGVALSAILKDTLSSKDYTQSQNPIIILDGLSDPQNIGAILRNCAAFGIEHVIMQDKGSPDITGALAKAAAGAVEYVHIHKVTNLTRTLNDLQSAGFIVYGADGETEHRLSDIKFPKKTVIVMGSEGNGIRKLIKNNCDMVFKIPISDKMESLNVANAFAIIIYNVTSHIIT